MQAANGYTHRVAISNSRRVKLEDGQVSFRWKDDRSASADFERPRIHWLLRPGLLFGQAEGCWLPEMPNNWPHRELKLHRQATVQSNASNVWSHQQ
jgi:hypothetical protein